MTTKIAKTAISLPKELLAKTDALAKADQTTRSAVVIQALTEFIQHRENQELLAALDKAYEEEPLTQEETAVLKAGMSHFAKNIVCETFGRRFASAFPHKNDLKYYSQLVFLMLNNMSRTEPSSLLIVAAN